MWALTLLSLLLSVVALVRVGRAGREIDTLHRRVRLLRSVLTPAEVLPAASSPPATATTAPPLPDLWGPEFSRARISIIGGALVLGGLAFTLRELGLPDWTILLAVFAFGGLLYGTGRLSPWPVSGALRGLGYGVTALGLGSLAQKLPAGWGAAAVMAGLLLLSALLVWDGTRRREPLLGVLAVAGAALSGWMLTDDLGALSVPALGAALLLGGVALSGWPDEPAEGEGGADPWPPARALLLAVCAAVPLGWLTAALSHWAGDGAARIFQLEQGTGLLCWLAFSGLALAPALALGRGKRLTQTAPPWLLLPAAAATLLPQWLVAGALGAALAKAVSPLSLLLGLLPLLLVGAAAALAWRERQRQHWAEGSLGDTLSSSLTAAASGIFAALALALLGGRGEFTALAGLALVLLLLDVYGQSRLWTLVGAAGTALVAAWAVADLPTHATAQALLLAALPALLGLRGAWALLACPLVAGASDALLLAGWCGLLLVVVAAAAGPLWLAGTVLLLAGALRLTTLRLTTMPDALRQRWWTAATLPALLLGGWQLLEAQPTPRLLALVTVLAALTTLRHAQKLPALAPLAEGLALALLALGLAAVLPGETLAKLPLALAVCALVAAALPLKLPPRRVDILLALGAAAGGLAALWLLLDGTQGSGLGLTVWLGIVALLPAWFLTRTGAGQTLLGRLKIPLLPPDAAPVRTLWLAALLMLTVNTSILLFPRDSFLSLSMTAASLVGLGIGLHAAIGGHRASRSDQKTPEPRTLWTVGLGLMLFAGAKAATLDALTYDNAGAAAGLAVLVTGLSLLLVAIFAPRPGEG